MDISGVDVDNLSDEEILELCGDIADVSDDEIFVLRGVDVNNLSDEKVQEVYDNIIESNTINNLTDKQILDINKNIVDSENSEILLLNGGNVNFDNLSEDEILSLYNDTIEQDKSVMLAGSFGQTYNCAVAVKTYTVPRAVYLYCFVTGATIEGYDRVSIYNDEDGDYGYSAAWEAGQGNGWCQVKCSGYKVLNAYCMDTVNHYMNNVVFYNHEACK